MSKSELETQLAAQIRDAGLPEPVREYRFARAAMGRQWRLDFAWPEQRVGAEVQGGTWARGRHVQPVGYENDCQKWNAAQSLGWRLFLFTGRMLNADEAIPVLREALL